MLIQHQTMTGIFHNACDILWSLTCTFGSADEGWSWWPRPTLARPGEQHTDMVLCIWIQVPELIGNHVNSKDLRPRRLAGPIFDFPTDDGAVAQNGVCV